MYTLKLTDLKALDAAGLQAQIDKAISAMLYPHDDPEFVWPESGTPTTLQITDDTGQLLAGNVVALRYLWFLYKKATIPNYTGDTSPSWYEHPAARG
jgi:hypothetical protein